MVVATKFKFREGFFGANVGSTENQFSRSIGRAADVVVASKFNFLEGFFGGTNEI